jgi:hypothetical protein
MFELKPLSKDGIPRAISKAERYRLLNEPRDAESICRDILRTDPGNQDAVTIMLLALTDQFGKDRKVAITHAQEMATRIDNDYARAYYTGVICERWAKAQLDSNVPGYAVFEWFHRAMEHYEAAEAIRPSGNEDAILRWNACARIIKRNDALRPMLEDLSVESGFTDDVPM